jgi:rod shape-determining protein MreB
MGPFSRSYGIDLGTANTVVYKPGNGVVLNEPSYMLMREARREPLLVGREARDLTGRTSARMTTVRPLQDGVITDLQTARAFIKAVLARAPRQAWEFGRPCAVIGVPVGATAIERRTLVEAV